MYINFFGERALKFRKIAVNRFIIPHLLPEYDRLKKFYT